MATTWPKLERITFEENDNRLKVTLPVDRNWLFLGLYSSLLIVWLIALVLGLVALFGIERGVMRGLGLIVWISVVLLLFYLWFRLGGHIARWWQYYLADRELLFLDKKVLIVRRPVSIFGVTDAYDMEYVTPFFYSAKHDTLAFRYGNKGILFGESLTVDEREVLLELLNARFFPNYDPDNV